MIPAPGQRVKQGSVFMALNLISLSYHLMNVSSLLIVQKKKELRHRTEPLNMGASGGANLLQQKTPGLFLLLEEESLGASLCITCYSGFSSECFPFLLSSHDDDKNDGGSSHSRNRDSGFSCVTLGRPLNLSGLPAYSSVSVCT